MVESGCSPSAGALDEVRRLAGPSAAIEAVTRLEGGQHATTWRVQLRDPAMSVVVRQFPVGDSAAAHERGVLRALDGLGGLAPVLLGSDLDARWSASPTLLLSWLDGEADVAPSDRERWAVQLGEALATIHAAPSNRFSSLPSVFDHSGASQAALAGPLAASILSMWRQITAFTDVLTHSDYWSGNVIWRDEELAGVVDWSGGGRGPRGFDLGWCRLDLFLLFDERVADIFLDAYEAAVGGTVDDMALWDSWAAARSQNIVASWVPNYAPLGRPDLDAAALRDRHALWTERLLRIRGERA
jgi:aminoglycoside phosphotransferase (APT) family kinase protein